MARSYLTVVVCQAVCGGRRDRCAALVSHLCGSRDVRTIRAVPVGRISGGVVLRELAELRTPPIWPRGVGPRGPAWRHLRSARVVICRLHVCCDRARMAVRFPPASVSHTSSSLRSYGIALAIVVVPAAELAIYLNQAVGRTEVYGYSPMITRVGFLAGVALIPALALRPSWTYLAVCMIVSTAAAAAFSFAIMPRASWSGFRATSPTVLALLRYSWTLPFAAVSTYVVNWIDMWVIRAVRGVGSVGVYGWAYQITAIAGLAFAPIAVVLTPRVIDARLQHDDVRIRRYVDSILPAATALAAVIGILLVFVFPALQSIASPAYAPAYPVILILLAALPFQLIAYLVTPLANAYERLLPRIVLVSAAIAAVNTTGDLLLVPLLGISGAAVATTAAFIFGGLLLIVIIRAEGLAIRATVAIRHPCGHSAAVSGADTVLGGSSPRRGGDRSRSQSRGWQLRRIVRAERRRACVRNRFRALAAIGSALTMTEAIAPSAPLRQG